MIKRIAWLCRFICSITFNLLAVWDLSKERYVASCACSAIALCWILWDIQADLSNQRDKEGQA